MQYIMNLKEVQRGKNRDDGSELNDGVAGGQSPLKTDPEIRQKY